MKTIGCLSERLAVISAENHSVYIEIWEGIQEKYLTGNEPIELLYDAWLVSQLTTSDKTLFVYYDWYGLRITEDNDEAPDGSLVISNCKFSMKYTKQIEIPPVKKTKRVRLKKQTRSRR